jgi:CheY-like chemotaxis protein
VYERELKQEYESDSDDHAPIERQSILIVEDNPELRQFLTQCLGEVYHVIACSDGPEGWEKAVEVIPDIVVSDIMMGDVSGLDLCRSLKTDERTSQIPVILLTAMATKDNLTILFGNLIEHP